MKKLGNRSCINLENRIKSKQGITIKKINKYYKT